MTPTRAGRNTRTLVSALPGATRGCWAVTSAPSHGWPCRENSTEKLSPAGPSRVWDFNGATEVLIAILFPLPTLLSGCCVGWQLLGVQELCGPGQELPSQEQGALGAPEAALVLEPGTTLGTRTGWDRDPQVCPAWRGPWLGRAGLWGAGDCLCSLSLQSCCYASQPFTLPTSDVPPPALLSACFLSQVTKFMLLASGMAWLGRFTEEKM